MKITKPEMIIFDYGHTLLCEPDWNSDRGNAELMKYIIKNPKNCTLDDIRAETQKVFGDIENVRQTFRYDISARVGNRLTFEHLGVEFSLTPLEQEIIFWTAASQGAIMPYAYEMLDYLNETGIRTAVISNNIWSGEAIKDRFDRLLPDNRFEFIISSADYMIRKPDKRLFEIALIKAGLNADKVWYCGDRFENDVIGAKCAGMFPVFYDYTAEKKDISKEFDFLHIYHWSELIEAMETLK